VNYRPLSQRVNTGSPITEGMSRSRLDDSQISISPMFIGVSIESDLAATRGVNLDVLSRSNQISP
jgi:hypothetical protein